MKYWERYLNYFIWMRSWPSKTIFSWWCQRLNFTQNDIYGIFRCLKCRRHLWRTIEQPNWMILLMFKIGNLWLQQSIEFRVKVGVNRFIYKLIHSLPSSRFHGEPMKRFRSLNVVSCHLPSKMICIVNMYVEKNFSAICRRWFRFYQTNEKSWSM